MIDNFLQKVTINMKFMLFFVGGEILFSMLFFVNCQKLDLRSVCVRIHVGERGGVKCPKLPYMSLVMTSPTVNSKQLVATFDKSLIKEDFPQCQPLQQTLQNLFSSTLLHLFVSNASFVSCPEHVLHIVFLRSFKLANSASELREAVKI